MSLTSAVPMHDASSHREARQIDRPAPHHITRRAPDCGRSRLHEHEDGHREVRACERGCQEPVEPTRRGNAL